MTLVAIRVLIYILVLILSIPKHWDAVESMMGWCCLLCQDHCCIGSTEKVLTKQCVDQCAKLCMIGIIPAEGLLTVFTMCLRSGTRRMAQRTT